MDTRTSWIILPEDTPERTSDPVIYWIADKLICGACFRLRFSPIHGLTRLMGFCPGDKINRSLREQ